MSNPDQARTSENRHASFENPKPPFAPVITDNRREPEAETRIYQDKDGNTYMSIDPVVTEVK